MGFVEAITWNHIVIRDFKARRNFVPQSTCMHDDKYIYPSSHSYITFFIACKT
jgi:hypothetical protein